MKLHMRTLLRAWLLCVMAALAACASPRAGHNPAQAQPAHWQGKLALKVFSKPVQAISANFDLQGSPAEGELVLTSPMGTTLAHMQWNARSATLKANGEEKIFGSIQELAQKVTGSDLPVTSLFAWLEGRDAIVEGWQADLQDLPNGRINARHVEEVSAELKIILER